jgi:hypothetical protein
MEVQKRMSPLTALFIGLWFTGAVMIAAVTSVVLYGMRIVDKKATTVLSFAEDAVGNLPALVEALPRAVEQALGDRRAADYGKYLDVRVEFAAGGRSGGWGPVLTIHNTGSGVVSLLALRVAALNPRGIPQAEWTEVVATPLAFDDDWRGPILPGSTRHVVLGRRSSLPADSIAELNAAVEITDVRVWEPNGGSTRTVSTIP